LEVSASDFCPTIVCVVDGYFNRDYKSIMWSLDHTISYQYTKGVGSIITFLMCMEDLTSFVYCANDEDECAATNSGIPVVYMEVAKRCMTRGFKAKDSHILNSKDYLVGYGRKEDCNNSCNCIWLC